MRCPNCNFDNPPNFKFCGECDASLTDQALAAPIIPKDDQQIAQAPEEVPSTVDQAPDGERRHLTVMFCDLVGSTSLSEQLDPEELRKVVNDYQDVCAKVIKRCDGNIAQYLGDGILVYFGYPQAHEDDAQSAARAGLGIVEDMQHLNARFQQEMGINLAVRVGIHTGMVVVGKIGGGEALALGETPNIAARMRGLADPNTVVISDDTFRLIRGFFTCQALGARALKGISRSLSVFQVLHETGMQTRLDAASSHGLTPLVGKEKEIELLLASWQRAAKGNGQIMWIIGEAGIGKSRLLRAFNERLVAEPHLWLKCRCSSYHQDSPFFPVIDLLMRLLAFQREDSCDLKTGKLAALLEQHSFSLSEGVPIFSDLLSIPIGECFTPLKLNASRLKQKTIEAWLQLLVKMAALQPVIFVVEDLHWADASTKELLSLLIAQKPAARLLTVLTSRPEFAPDWQGSSQIVTMTLNRLTENQIETMVAQVAASKNLPTLVLKQIVAKTDGVPLFVEELTKMVLESDLLQAANYHYELSGALPALAIPATLHDSLMARLDRLARVKQIAQIGATIGRAFSYELIEAVANLSNIDETTLQQGLAQLVKAELLYQQPAPNGGMTYIFKHALILDAA
jgi:class 3 adenylate cyclase